MAIITEHEAMVEKTAQGSLPDTPDLVKQVNELLARSKRHRKRYDSEWNYNYEFACSGRQWSQERPRWRFSEVVNVTWASIMTEIALQTDSRPKFEFSPQEPSDIMFVETLKKVNDRNWDRYNWNQVIVDGLFDCKLYHVAHAIVEWDQELEYGLGDVCFKMLDPYYCFWDPKASDVNKGERCRFFIYAEPVPTSELKMKHQDKADKIKPDVSNMENRNDSGLVGTRFFQNFDPYQPSRLPSSANAQGDMYGGEPHTVLIRCWMRDDTLEELAKEKEDGTKEFIVKKKYPHGRYVEVCNNIVLRDGPQGVEVNGEWVPYNDECFPIARLVNYQYPREYAGENELTHTKGPQKILNYIWSYVLDNFKMQGNPVTLIGAGADVDEEEVTNEPGNIIKASDINQVRREPGIALSPGSLDLMGQAMSLLDKVQGLSDVSKGAEMSNATSAVMLEGYIEAAQTRPRMKNRNLDAFLQDVGELVLKRYLQFYTKPRMVRITNEEGYPEFLEFYMSEDGKAAKIKQFSTIDGKVVPGMQQTMEVKGCPDVKIVSGSALPYAKAQKANTALTYFNAGAIDEEELLKSVDWPNRQEVLARIAEKKAQEAQAAAPQ